ncbi:MAG: hypothetical protein EGP82_08075 [Odoribacter splanchnicus]|nr:hypothetical protein [Odoribacter splanchnicus]
MPCPRYFPYPHKTLRFPHFPDRRFKGFPPIVRPAKYYDNPGSNRTAYIPDKRKKFPAFKFRLQSPTVSPSPKTNKNKLQEEAKNTKKVKIPKNQKQRKYAHKNQLCAILNN